MQTQDQAYADYLIRNQASLISATLQLPYRAHLKFLKLGKTLDIGCGAGRNLKALPAHSIGIDHNEWVVKACIQRGYLALTTDTFLSQGDLYENDFDSILLSHVAEHMTGFALTDLLLRFGRFLKPGGNIVMICPQEVGYESDSTHVHFLDFKGMEAALISARFNPVKKYSFPFPRICGKLFKYNEFVVVGVK